MPPPQSGRGLGVRFAASLPMSSGRSGEVDLRRFADSLRCRRPGARPPRRRRRGGADLLHHAGGDDAPAGARRRRVGRSRALRARLSRAGERAGAHRDAGAERRLLRRRVLPLPPRRPIRAATCWSRSSATCRTTSRGSTICGAGAASDNGYRMRELQGMMNARGCDLPGGDFRSVAAADNFLFEPDAPYYFGRRDFSHALRPHLRRLLFPDQLLDDLRPLPRGRAQLRGDVPGRGSAALLSPQSRRRTGEHDVDHRRALFVAADRLPVSHQPRFRLHLPAAPAATRSRSPSPRRSRSRRIRPRRCRGPRPAPGEDPETLADRAGYLRASVPLPMESRPATPVGHRRRRASDPHRRPGLLGKQGAGRRGDRAGSELRRRGARLILPEACSIMKLLHSGQWTERSQRSFEVQGAEHGVELSIIVEDMPAGGGPTASQASLWRSVGREPRQGGIFRRNSNSSGRNRRYHLRRTGLTAQIPQRGRRAAQDGLHPRVGAIFDRVARVARAAGRRLHERQRRLETRTAAGSRRFSQTSHCRETGW